MNICHPAKSQNNKILNLKSSILNDSCQDPDIDPHPYQCQMPMASHSSWPSPFAHITCWFSPQVNLLWPQELISMPAISRFLCTSFGIFASQECCWSCTACSDSILKSPTMPISASPRIPLLSSSPRAGRRMPCLKTESGGGLPPRSWAPLYIAIQSNKSHQQYLGFQLGYLARTLKPYIVTSSGKLHCTIMRIVWQTKTGLSFVSLAPLTPSRFLIVKYKLL